ncbi:unnamed protein product, partial [Cuscuta europaea]
MPPKKDMSWWNDEVKQAIRTKRECYKKLGKSRSGENLEEYKEARRRARKVVKEARGKVNKGLYVKLNSKEGEKDIYRLAQDITGSACRLQELPGSMPLHPTIQGLYHWYRSTISW